MVSPQVPYVPLLSSTRGRLVVHTPSAVEITGRDTSKSAGTLSRRRAGFGENEDTIAAVATWRGLVSGEFTEIVEAPPIYLA